MFLITMFTVTTATANNIQTYSNNVRSTNASFTISSTGKATLSIEYNGISSVTKNAIINSKIQKKVGLIWVTVNDAKWKDISKTTNYYNSHSTQLSSKGNYRAYITYVISGNGGKNDEITKTIEKTYS